MLRPPVVDVKRLLQVDPARFGSLALLILRLATGFVLAPHGWAKLADGAQKLAGGLAAKGVPAAHLFAWCATLSELVGSLLVAAGLLTRPAAAVVSFTMVFAWISSHLGDLPNIGAPGGAAFEYPFLLSMVALAIAIAGPGRYSVDAILVRMAA